MYDKNPRSEAKKITLGTEKPKFLGKKGNAVYQQEFFSLVNVKSQNRDNTWNQKFKSLCEEIEKNNLSLLESLKNKYQHLDPKIR
tara:strand:- start:92 stop:346 length:255 start_codon:yes stop_codon:yes gene_type:complete